jgi:hypothetical protein
MIRIFKNRLEIFEEYFLNLSLFSSFFCLLLHFVVLYFSKILNNNVNVENLKH